MLPKITISKRVINPKDTSQLIREAINLMNHLITYDCTIPESNFLLPDLFRYVIEHNLDYVLEASINKNEANEYTSVTFVFPVINSSWATEVKITFYESRIQMAFDFEINSYITLCQAGEFKDIVKRKFPTYNFELIFGE